MCYFKSGFNNASFILTASQFFAKLPSSSLLLNTRSRHCRRLTKALLCWKGACQPGHLRTPFKRRSPAGAWWQQRPGSHERIRANHALPCHGNRSHKPYSSDSDGLNARQLAFQIMGWNGAQAHCLPSKDKCSTWDAPGIETHQCSRGWTLEHCTLFAQYARN